MSMAVIARSIDRAAVSQNGFAPVPIFACTPVSPPATLCIDAAAEREPCLLLLEKSSSIHHFHRITASLSFNPFISGDMVGADSAVVAVVPFSAPVPSMGLTSSSTVLLLFSLEMCPGLTVLIFLTLSSRIECDGEWPEAVDSRRRVLPCSKVGVRNRSGFLIWVCRAGGPESAGPEASPLDLEPKHMVVVWLGGF
jgi:hypothetical protein